MKKVHISKLAGKPLLAYLAEEGCRIDLVSGSTTAAENIRTHADLYCCDLGDHIFFGDPSLVKNHYPQDVRYNAACTGKYFIHNLKYTDPALLREAEAAGLEMVDVSQGYAKCNTLAVDEDSIITSDAGIAKEAEKHGMDVLKIGPGHIVLEPYDYGFIGGASGTLVSADKRNRTVFFNGNVTAHPDFKKMERFILQRGCSMKYFRDYPLTDIGSAVIEEI